MIHKDTGLYEVLGGGEIETEDSI
ncbi:hypothetical protein RSC2_03871 [Bacillus paralicheniformis]|nr:hypothetical protein RSC1_02009 [Bacillus paralicheniformis]BCE12075.1 hypothetical protein RSC2_03871 [Bacillus paralicheniformis]BCE13694.1 hypothetical protein RSC3_01050 [Bacillus paralicheniformis]